MSKELLAQATTPRFADLTWTSATMPVYPAIPQNFAVGGILPAIFYLFRRGVRRGTGHFHKTYRSGSAVTISSILEVLACGVAEQANGQAARFVEFRDELRKEVLGDLLLAHTLENRRRSESKAEEVIRVYPSHFFASWVDLPVKVAHLRWVPEMVVALLAEQDLADALQPCDQGPFPIAKKPQENLMLRPFHRGVIFGDNPSQLSGDQFDEKHGLSVDELLSVAIGLGCGQAPEQSRSLSGKDSSGIPSRRPLSSRATRIFRDDLKTFLEQFADAVPRRALTPMLESLIGLGVWHSFQSSLRCVVQWERSYAVPSQEKQLPHPVFVDASGGLERDLQLASEESMDGVLRLLDEATVAMACVRILDAEVWGFPEMAARCPVHADGQAWLDLLGRVRSRTEEDSEYVLYSIRKHCANLQRVLTETASSPEVSALLSSPMAREDPTKALADALCQMMGEKLLQSFYLNFVDSAGMVNEPYGLVRKRRVRRTLSDGTIRRKEARSVVLSNELLEALVHTLLAQHNLRLSYAEFLWLLRDRYGLFVDEAPPEMSIDRELLLLNRALLESRLRDLGLLTTVNDAESMKLLRPRYRASSNNGHEG